MTLTDAEREAVEKAARELLDLNEKARTDPLAGIIGDFTSRERNFISFAFEHAASIARALLSASAERDAEVAELRAALPHPALSASIAEAIAYELECGTSAKSTMTTEAKVAWLRDLARQLLALDAARLRPTPTPATTTDEQETTK